MNKRAVIIGGGLGGLGIALRLAVAGWTVTLCEQGATFGGKMNHYCEAGFCFDTGPSLITMPWVFEELFGIAGARLQEHLDLIQIHPLAEYFFDDGTRFNCSASLPEWLAVVRQLDKRDADSFLKFMELGGWLYAISKETFLRRRPLDAPDARVFAALKSMPIRYGWGNYHQTVAAHFHSPYMVQLFDRYPTYVGSSPFGSPATLAVIPYIEFAFGGWYVRGGLYRIVECLLELLKNKGVTLLNKTRVERIEQRNGRVSSVMLGDGTRLEANVVVMNGDASVTPKMLGTEQAKGLPVAERSLSGLVFLFGVNRTIPEIEHHTVYFSADYQKEFAQLFDERRFPDDPTVYVNAPSRSDRSIVPEAGETLFVMANAPATDEVWDEAKIAEARRRVFRRLKRGGFPDIEDDIVVNQVWTPMTIAERYLMPGGAIYGTHSHGWKKAFLRPPNKDKRIGGLYYVGGSTHPGGGTPTVLLSAKITSELIARYEGK
jgi:phytoene desaturase